MSGRRQLPATPLLDLIEDRARAADMSLSAFMCDRFGHNADRSFWRWKAGGNVNKTLADDICVALGAHAVDLWPELARARTPPNHLEIVVVDDWKERAACLGESPEIFFSPDAADLAIARSICMTCPVFDPCFEAGLSEQHGIWAGTSERERRRLRKERGIQLPAEPADLEETA